jgi:hypothetical protein
LEAALGDEVFTTQRTKGTRLRDEWYQNEVDQKVPLRKYESIVSGHPMKLADLSKKEVRKHIGAIHVNGKLTLLQRKLANVLLWNAYEKLLSEEKHRIRIRDLAYLVGFDSNDLQVLKDALKGLAETPLEWNVLHEDGDEEWGVAAMLAQAVIRGGYCSYSYGPDLREKFYNPEIYARINIGIQRNITTGYALALYENCIRYRNVGSTGWIDLEDLRRLFGVDESSYYGTFKHFNNKLIKPSVEAVNKTSDLLVSARYQRERRRVCAVKFLIKENPQISLFTKRAAAEPPPAIEKTKRSEEQAGCRTELLDRLLSFGIAQSSAERYLREYSEEYLEGNLAVVEKDYRAGKVRDLPRYTASAIKEDSRPKRSPYERDAEKKRSIRRNAIDRQKREQGELESLRNEFEAMRLENALKRLSPEEKGDLEARFHDEHAGNLLYQKWGQEGLDHPVIRSLFRVFAARHLLETPTAEMFAAFVQRRRGESASVSLAA